MKKQETENYILRTFTIKFNINSAEWIFIHFVSFNSIFLLFLPQSSLQLFTCTLYSMLWFLWCRLRSAVKSTKTEPKTMATSKCNVFVHFQASCTGHLYTSSTSRGCRSSSMKIARIVSKWIEWNQITVAKVYVFAIICGSVRLQVSTLYQLYDMESMYRSFLYFLRFYVTKRMQEHTNIIEKISIVWRKSIVLEIFWCYTRLNIERKFLTCN